MSICWSHAYYISEFLPKNKEQSESQSIATRIFPIGMIEKLIAISLTTIGVPIIVIMCPPNSNPVRRERSCTSKASFQIRSSAS